MTKVNLSFVFTVKLSSQKSFSELTNCANRTGLNLNIIWIIRRPDCKIDKLILINAKSEDSRNPIGYFSFFLKWKTCDHAPKNQNFEKIENTRRYSPKKQVCKNSAELDHFWSLQPTLKFWEDRQTDTHRERKTERQSQILAQLKLKIIRRL